MGKTVAHRISGQIKELLVNVFAVPNGHHQHEQLLIFDLAKNPVITDPVAPQPGQTCLESFANTAGKSYRQLVRRDSR
jgi:hypothetical protein